jgi:hypothetical protein
MSPTAFIHWSEVFRERSLSLRAFVYLMCLVALLPASAQNPPTITLQPQDQMSCIGGNVTFQIAVTGTPPFSFTWYSNAIPVFNEITPSNSSFTIINLNLSNNGDDFFVHVNNFYGSQFSSNATLFVHDPGICEQPTNIVVGLGSTITFHVGATGTSLLYYQWFFEGTPLTDGGFVFGANSPDLSIGSAATTNSGFYQVIVTDYAGSITSVLARCDVAVAPMILNQPFSRVCRFKANTTFSVNASGTQPRFYQWYRNDVMVANATNSTLTLTNVQRPEVGLYYVTVSNAAGVVASDRVHLQIRLTLEGSNSILREEATDALTSLTNAITLNFVSPPTLVNHGVPLLFTTYGSTAEAWETNQCVTTASHSMWVVYYSPRAESTRVSTEGSDFDTIVSVYTWDGKENHPPTFKVCDDNSGYDGTSSRLYFSAETPKDYYIKVDGVGGATGTVRLEVGETIRKMGFTTNGAFHFEIAGAFWFDNTLQSTTNAEMPRYSWPVLLTMPATYTDWVIGYTNTSALSDVCRFYEVGVNTNSSP